MTPFEIRQNCRNEYYECVRERWDNLMATCIQQGVMDTYVDYETYLQLNPRGGDNDSLDFEAFGFQKAQKFIEFFKNDEYDQHVKYWKNLRMMPLRNAGYDAEFEDENGKTCRLEIKVRLFPITMVIHDFQPQMFCEFEEKDLKNCDYVLMFFWRLGEHGKVDWALFQADESIFHRDVVVKARNKSVNYEDGKKEYPATGFFLDDAGFPDCRMMFGGEKDEAI
jgi:hypothetical protein